MKKSKKEFHELVMAIGTVTYLWAQIERQLENWVALIFHDCDGNKIREKVPHSLKAKVAFLRKSFRKIEALTEFKLHALDLLNKVNKNAENRHAFVHGTVYSLTPKSFEFTRMKSFEQYYEIKKKKFSAKTYQAFLHDLLRLQTDTSDLLVRLTKTIPHKK